jgi:hypothetical protein
VKIEELGEYYNLYLNEILSSCTQNTTANYIVKDKVIRAYHDALNFEARENLTKFLIYQAVRDGYKLSPFPLEEALLYLNEILTDDKLMKKIVESNPHSEFYSVLKDIIPFKQKLDELVEDNKNYLVLKMYEQIYDFLNAEALSLYEGKDLENECLKRYPLTYDTPLHYQNRMKKREYVRDDGDILRMPKMKNFSRTCKLLTHYFYEKALDFYNKTGYLYRPISEDIAFFKLGKIGAITYKYDDTFKIMVKDLDTSLEYSADCLDFWAISYDETIDKEYTISFDNPVNYYGPLIVCPYEYLDEAFIKELAKRSGADINDDAIIEKLTNLGFDPEIKDNLICDIFGSYLKNPHNISLYKFKDVNEYPTLSKLLAKNDEDRCKYINRVLTNYQIRRKKILADKYLKYYRKVKKNNSNKEWLD